MNTKEAYKIGFMLKCAELGQDPEKAARDLIKVSFFGLGPAISGAGHIASAVLSKWPLALALGTIPPVAGGAFIGSQLADATDPPVNIDEIKAEETQREYEEAIRRLRSNLRSRGVKV